MIEGLSHITLVVRDLDRMTDFLTSIFDAEEVYASGDATFSLSREKFFVIGGVWVAIMEGDPLLTRTYNHIAFKIAPSDLPMYRVRLAALDVSVREGRSRVDGEGQSLYFYDDDNHLFELHTGTLTERLARYS